MATLWIAQPNGTKGLTMVWHHGEPTHAHLERVSQSPNPVITILGMPLPPWPSTLSGYCPPRCSRRFAPTYRSILGPQQHCSLVPAHGSALVGAGLDNRGHTG